MARSSRVAGAVIIASCLLATACTGGGGGDGTPTTVEPGDGGTSAACPTVPDAPDGLDPVGGAGDAGPEVVELATYDGGRLSDGNGSSVVEMARANACSQVDPALTLECRLPGGEPGDEARPTETTEDPTDVPTGEPEGLRVQAGEGGELTEAYIRLDRYVEFTPGSDEPVASFRVDGTDGEPSFDDLLRQIQSREDQREAGTVVGFEYVLFPMMGYGIHPADNPTRVDPSTYANPRPGAPGQAPIVVIDSGLPEALPDLGLLGFDFVDDVTELGGPPETIPASTSLPGVAHGLMVAGVAGQQAEGSPIQVANAQDDDDLVFTLSSIERALARVTEPSIVVMSLGTYGCDVGRLLASVGDEELLPVAERIGDGLQALEGYIRQLAETNVVVASAGNNDSDQPMYPAAFDDVIGVAATDDTVPNTAAGDTFDCDHVWETDGGGDPGCDPDPSVKPWFSNHGPWVDACAPGTDLVTAYPADLEFAYLEYDPATMLSNPFLTDVPGPLVRISGTSFSAPFLAGWLAGRDDVIDTWQARSSVADYLAEVGWKPCPW